MSEIILFEFVNLSSRIGKKEKVPPALIVPACNDIDIILKIQRKTTTNNNQSVSRLTMQAMLIVCVDIKGGWIILLVVQTI